MISVFMRSALKEDVKQLCKIYFEAELMLNDNKIKGWPEDYPDVKILNGRIAEGKLYTFCDYKDRVVGAAVMYKDTTDAESDVPLSDDALLICDMVLDRKHRYRGNSATIYMYAERVCRHLKCSKLRIYTDFDNFFVKNSMIRYGFDFISVVKMPDNTVKYCYEKKVEISK